VFCLDLACSAPFAQNLRARLLRHGQNVAQKGLARSAVLA